ncbi:MAG: TetR/AcrR family transcriptional regulator [Cyclobacteriaceae bacterium]|nr:TetR/AcrR family transcriptional regulator [Cyclobacteriaceae bacterium]
MPILSFKLNTNLFLRDPQSSELGQKIIEKSIEMIDELGFEQFTFRKLADQIESTEASVYRYFENKHRLLLYLIDWYWMWLEYRLDFSTQNIKDPRERLRLCLQLLAEEKHFDSSFAFVDEQALQRIVVSDFEKTYLTKQVDVDNKDGLFLPFKSVCKKISNILKEINPHFPYPNSLVSTVMLAMTHQLYYAEHLPSLTDIKYNPKLHHKKLYEFLEAITFKTLDQVKNV